MHTSGANMITMQILLHHLDAIEAHVTPNKRETWVPHTASGFYIGNAWEHYHCHEIYICDTKHTRTCLTTFFKHKYLTMPTITPADALI